VDSLLAQGSDLAVQEMLNGCLCCVLVGQMKLTLMELKDKYKPDRILLRQGKDKNNCYQDNQV